MSYVEGKASDVGVWFQRFYYAEDLKIGQLVRLSDDMTVSAIKAGTGAVDILDTGADGAIGVCEQAKVVALSNPNGTDMIDVRMFGHFQRQATIVAPVAGIDAGDVIALVTGVSMLALTSGDQGDEVQVLVP
jgi:hypothetical protein